MFIMEFATPIESNETSLSLSRASLQTNLSSISEDLNTLSDIIHDCNKNGTPPARVPLQILIFILSLPSNTLLLGLLLKNIKNLSPSEVLGLNLTVLSLLFTFNLPFDIAISTTQRAGLPLYISHTFSTLSYFGCPVLLTSMCVERYVAVVHPVLFMSMGKWEYRAACSAIIWILTCIMAALTFVYTLSIMALVYSVIVNLLFIIMVASLLGIVGVLRKKGPGEGDQNSSNVKKRALKNVKAILVPSAITYFPLLGLIPFLTIIKIMAKKGTNSILCNFLEMYGVFPNFGICIGPMFYMVRLRNMLCSRNKESKDSRETTTDQKK